MSYIANIVRSPGDPKILSSGHSSLTGTDRLSRALGWFSVGLGLAELIAPRTLARALGFHGSHTLVRTYGMRELAAGALVLSPDKKLGLWARAVGDVVDLATLGRVSRPDNPRRGNAGKALGFVLAVTVLDLIAACAASAESRRSERLPVFADRSGFPGGLERARGAARKAAEE